MVLGASVLYSHSLMAWVHSEQAIWLEVQSPSQCSQMPPNAGGLLGNERGPHLEQELF